MRNVNLFSAREILAIPENEPERLFSSPEAYTLEYKILAKKWHPDIGGDSHVFAHIGVLRKKVIEKISLKVWEAPDTFVFTSTENKEFRLRYKKKTEFELGKSFLSKTILAYQINSEHCPDLSENMRRAISSFKFADAKMKEVIGRDLPEIIDFKKTKNNGDVVLLHKHPNLIRVRDLRDFLGGQIPAAHVAWIISRLLSHAVYFDWAKITHNDLSMDTVFINPKDHTVSVLGGWYYSAPEGSRLSFLPVRTVEAGPASLKINKIATIRTDAELIKLMAREMLGADAKKDFPDIFKWSLSHQSMRALDSLRHWSDKVLPAAFGPKKFVPLNVTAEEVYNF